MVAVARTPEVYLPPGGLYAGPAPCRLRTVLGSCVSVTLWSRSQAVGGMNHFVMPRGGSRGEGALRHGETALELLLLRMVVLGAAIADLEARVFGGASIGDSPVEAWSLGARNVQCARRWLRARRVRTVEEVVLGSTARRIVLDLTTGATTVTALGEVTDR